MNKLPANVLEEFRRWGRLGGLKARALSTPAERVARAKHAVRARKTHPVKPENR